MRLNSSKTGRARNNKLIFYTLVIYAFLAFNVLGTGGCKWNSDYRSRIQPNPELEADPVEALSAEEASLQDAINESESDSTKALIPGKAIPAAPDLPQ
jgi:hypothetical protein